MLICLKHRELNLAIVQHKTVIPCPASELLMLLGNPSKWPEFLGAEIFAEMQTEAVQLHLHQEIPLRLSRFGVSSNFKIRVEEVSKTRIRLRQVLGLFKHWELLIEVSEHSESESLLIESVNYSLPFGLVGALLDDLLVRSDVRSILMERHEKLVAYLE